MKRMSIEASLARSQAKITKFGVQSVVWAYNKVMRTALQGLHVDSKSLAAVKKLLKDGRRVVLMPVYRSFADLFTFVYIHQHFGIQPPFMLLSEKDQPPPALQYLLRSVGLVTYSLES